MSSPVVIFVAGLSSFCTLFPSKLAVSFYMFLGYTKWMKRIISTPVVIILASLNCRCIYHNAHLSVQCRCCFLIFFLQRMNSLMSIPNVLFRFGLNSRCFYHKTLFSWLNCLMKERYISLPTFWQIYFLLEGNISL